MVCEFSPSGDPVMGSIVPSFFQKEKFFSVVIQKKFTQTFGAVFLSYYVIILANLGSSKIRRVVRFVAYFDVLPAISYC